MVAAKVRSRLLVYWLVISLACLGAERATALFLRGEALKERVAARDHMQQAMLQIRQCREASGYPVDYFLDPNGTGLIGVEVSAITTTLGHLEAKRTSTNPDTAALMVRLFQQIGLQAGDVVAIGSSGSFPALWVAAVSACKVLQLVPLSILSVGASQYGANLEGFTLLDMAQCLVAGGFEEFLPIAVSAGGDDDVAADLEEGVREGLYQELERCPYFFIREAELPSNVALRMRLYQENAGSRGIKAFVNIGGSMANTGTSPQFLELRPGINTVKDIPPPAQRGVLYEMASEGIPVIHLLYIQGLCVRYGLAYDPVPFPGNTSSEVYLDELETGSLRIAWFACFGVYVVLLLLPFFGGKKWLIQK